MIIVLIRAIILYLVVLISMRIMGKGELGELQPFDVVVTLMMAELAVLPMEDLDAPLIHGPIAIITLMTLQVIISSITQKSNKLRGVICGKPIILIDHGRFNVKEMKRLRININDILEQLRVKGYKSVDDVDYVLIETNGQMSVIAPQEVPAQTCKRIPISVILDGKLLDENVNKYKISKDLIYSELMKKSLSVRDVIYGFIDEDDAFTFYKREEQK